MTTVPEPLSADLITMSLRLPRSFQACRSRAVKLSRTGANVRGLVAFGTQLVGIGLRRMVMKVLEESHTSAKFIEISSNFSPVNVTWSRTKGKTSCKQRRLATSKSVTA